LHAFVYNGHQTAKGTVSIHFLFSIKGRLSLMSLEVIHVFIWSLSRYRR